MDDNAHTQPDIDDIIGVTSVPEILISTEELLKLLDLALAGLGVGAGRRFAIIAGVTTPEVSQARRGDRPPSERIAAALGYRRYTGWEPLPGWTDRHELFGEAGGAGGNFIEIEE